MVDGERHVLSIPNVLIETPTSLPHALINFLKAIDRNPRSQKIRAREKPGIGQTTLIEAGARSIRRKYH